MNSHVIAHRGASACAPENTLPAFELAVRFGAASVEHDLHATRDGALVCLHDRTLERTTDVAHRFPDRARERIVDGRAMREWLVDDLTVAELRELDAGSWFGPAFAGTRIPTFDDLLEWARGRVALLTELKDPEAHRRRGADLLSLAESVLRRHRVMHTRQDSWITVQSFDEQTIRRAADVIGTRVPIVLLLEPDDTPPLTTARLASIARFATGIGPGKPILERDPAVVARAHGVGLRVTPWTFRISTVGAFPSVGAEMRHYIVELGVDAVITDHPEAYPDEGGND